MVQYNASNRFSFSFFSVDYGSSTLHTVCVRVHHPHPFRIKTCHCSCTHRHPKLYQGGHIDARHFCLNTHSARPFSNVIDFDARRAPCVALSGTFGRGWNSRDLGRNCGTRYPTCQSELEAFTMPRRLNCLLPGKTVLVLLEERKRCVALH